MACSRHDNLPCSPSDPSRNDVWKVEGVSTFSLGVLVRGYGTHRYFFFHTHFGPRLTNNTENRNSFFFFFHGKYTINSTLALIKKRRGAF